MGGAAGGEPGADDADLVSAGRGGEGGGRRGAGGDRAVCEAFGANGVQLAQSLIDPQDAALERVFAEAGFTRMAELYYLHAAPCSMTRVPALPAGMEWVTYDESREEMFGRAVLESYKDSLDCPALNGRREVGDVLAGHRASGQFDPSIWFLLKEGEASLGVLLLSESLRADAVELVYVGLAPAARGRRLGESDDAAGVGGDGAAAAAAIVPGGGCGERAGVEALLPARDAEGGEQVGADAGFEGNGR